MIHIEFSKGTSGGIHFGFQFLTCYESMLILSLEGITAQCLKENGIGIL